MELGLKGRVALVTGAAQGIGRAITLALAQEGASVAAADVNLEGAKKVAGEARKLGGRVEAVQCDVTQWESVRCAVAATLGAFGALHFLVNNAGIHLQAHLEETTDELWDRTMAVNLKGVFYCCKAAVPHMKAQKYGKIVNISSVAGRRGHRFRGSAYAASKAGVIAFTASLTRELQPYGIVVNAIAPGTVNTALLSSFTPEEMAGILRAAPSGRLMEPEDIVGTVLFLLSDVARQIVGQTITVDGGFLTM